MNWAGAGMAIRHISPRQPFSLFTLHFSLPEGTTFHFSLFTFHFPQGPLPLSQCTAVRCPMQRAASAVAVHCIRHRTALRFPTHYCQSPRAAFFTFHFSLFTYIMHCTAFPDLLLSESPRSIFHFSLFTLHLYHRTALRFPAHYCQSPRAAFFSLSSGVFL